MKESDKDMVSDIIENSVEAGIFELSSSNTENFCANLNCVAKPDPTLYEFGKADKEINKSLGLISNKSRICVDMRQLNDVLGAVPVVSLPKTSVLKERAFDSHLSSFNLTQFFYAISSPSLPKASQIFG